MTRRNKTGSEPPPGEAARQRRISAKTVRRRKPEADPPQVQNNVIAEPPPGPVSADEVLEVKIDGESVIRNKDDEAITEEAQIVGADVVPRVTITTEAPATLLSDWDYHLFNEGSHHRLWEKLGSHPLERD